MMRDAQQAVLLFHDKFGAYVADRPGFAGDRGGGGAHTDAKGDELRVRLVQEECKELADAVEAGDFPAAIDALADIIYVVLGSAVSWGVDIAPIFVEVHAANMRKEGGKRRADGKILKPDGWVGPDIFARLIEQGWTGGPSKYAPEATPSFLPAGRHIDFGGPSK